MESFFGTDVEIGNSYIELDEMPDPANPPSGVARIYLQNTAEGSELVVRWNNGTEDVLAAD